MKKSAIFFAIVVTYSTCSFPTYADELAVSGNGEGSSSQVSINANNTNTTTQDNNANVQNNTSVDANTGNNSASNNTGGDTAVQTGDVTVDTSIQNSLNGSTVTTPCCQNGVNGTITDNGSSSTNTIDLSYTTNTTNVVNQTATIFNNIQGLANTGNNYANNNGGKTTIYTGSIWVSDTIKNGPINVSHINSGVGMGGDITSGISGNGANSVNTVRSTFESNTTVYNIFTANIINNSVWDLNTGGNNANGNIGGADLKTGDIYFASKIVNGPINISSVDVGCCKKDNPSEPPVGGENPTNENPSAPSGSVGGASSTGGSGSNSGGIGGIGGLLPTTGSLWTLFMTLASMVLFFFGWYLRFRSGNAPPQFAYAK